MSNITDRIRKLVGSDNTDDNELAILLLESDSISLADKKEYIKGFIKENPDSFTNEERKLLEIWLELKTK